MKRPFLTFLALLVLLSPALSAQSWTINEWNVPYARSRPRDPFVDAQGKVWFVGQVGDYIAVLDPASGQFRKYDLDRGAGPHTVSIAPDGAIWYTGNASSHIGRLDPTTGHVTKFPIPDTSVHDPHTIAWDRHGDMWFTAQAGNVIGKLTVATGQIRLVRVSEPDARPYGIRMDPSGERPWIALFGTNKIATVDPATFELHEYAIPRANARPRRLAVTSDGSVWYGDYAGGMLGRFDPQTQRFEEWQLPGGARSRPYALMNDDQDRIWVVETGDDPNRFVGFDPRTHNFLPGQTVPSGGGTVRNMTWDPVRHVLWFGTDDNTIGRANIPPATATP